MKGADSATQEREAPSLSEHAYRTLRTAILDGALHPGERLRAIDLRRSYGLGLTPIREALTRLSVEGMITGETHRGARVRDASLDELADVTAARVEIERACLARAMAAGDAAWEAGIVAAGHLLSRTPLPEGPEDRAGAALWEGRHRAFHFALVSACGSQWLLRFWNTLADQSERYRAIRLIRRDEAEAEVRDVAAEHDAIMRAVVVRDAARALDLMTAHLRATADSVARLLSV